MADRNRGGSCLACHTMGPAGGAALPGNVGPDLSEIGNAGREDEWLYNYVFDGRVYNPETVMPRRGWTRAAAFQSLGMRRVLLIIKVPDNRNSSASGCNSHGPQVHTPP